MATSGTYTFNLNFADILEEACQLAKINPQQFTGDGVISARRALNLILREWATKKFPVWKLEFDTIPLTANTISYLLDAEIQDVIWGSIRSVVGGVDIDIPISRLDTRDYMAIPDKAASGRPVQFFVQPLRDQRQVYFWPVTPTNNTYEFYFAKLLEVEDVDTMAQNIDVPKIFLPALTTTLAVNFAMKRPTTSGEGEYPMAANLQHIAFLQGVAKEQMEAAFDEWRERTPFYATPTVPSVGRY